jgi:hypothetical protein
MIYTPQWSHKIARALPLLAFIISLNLIGCIQHRYLSTIHLDESISHTYEAVGDSADLYDGKITLPTGLWWETETDVEYDSSGNAVHIYRARMNLRSPRHLPQCYAPETTHRPDIFLRHPLYFKRVDTGIGVLFLFRQTFVNRQKDAKYGNIRDYIDPECRALLDGELEDSLSDQERARLESLYLDGLVAWSRAMVLRRCQAILEQNLEFNPDTAFTPKQLKQAMASAEAYVREWVPEDGGIGLLAGDVNLWETLGEPAMSRIIEELTTIGESRFFETLDYLQELDQWGYEITKDLEDDEFLVIITLPGTIFYDNANEKTQDSLTWEFSGTDIFNDDMVLKAYSMHIRWLPVSGLVVLILAAVILISRRKTGTDTAEPPSAETK